MLLILGLLLGGLLAPLNAQIERRRLGEARIMLAEIRGVLLAFAVVHGRLPCPTWEPDPYAANYGLEDCGVTAPGAEGYLPWRTLGVSPTDPWSAPRRAAGDPWRGYWRYRPDRGFSQSLISLHSQTRSGPDQLRVIDRNARSLSSASDPPVAVVFSTGADGLPSDENSRYEPGPGAYYQAGEISADFDDHTLWLSRLVLFDRLLQAGRLP